MANPFKDVDTITAGREATVVRGVVEPWVKGSIQDKLTTLIAIYRSGEYTHDILVGNIAEISALQSLIDNLTSLERRGTTAMEREHAKGQT